MEPTVIALATLGVVATLGAATVRRVPPGHRGMVTRGGRLVRTSDGGLLFRLPGLERADVVALHPAPIDPLYVRARTTEGVDLALIVRVFWRVPEPVLATRLGSDIRSDVGDAVDLVLRRAVADTDLHTALRQGRDGCDRWSRSATAILADVGVEVTDLDVVDMEVHAGPELLDLLS